MRGRILGAVLAGGASSRFGSDKALALFEGQTLLDRAGATLAPFVGEVVVVGRGEVLDMPGAGLGPLGGIAGALDHGRRRGFESVLTVACDMVRLPDGLIETLMERAPAYCAEAPVLGHWPAALAAGLIGRLASRGPSSRTCSGIGRSAKGRGDNEGERGLRRSRDAALSVRRWAIDIGALAIPSPGPIANVNTPADLAAL